MKLFVRFTAIVLVVALSGACATKASHAGRAFAPTARNCFFVRNSLGCPCPRAQQARVVVRAAYITAEAIGTAIEATAVALTRAERKHVAPVAQRDAAHPAPASTH